MQIVLSRGRGGIKGAMEHQFLKPATIQLGKYRNYPRSKDRWLLKAGRTNGEPYSPSHRRSYGLSGTGPMHANLAKQQHTLVYTKLIDEAIVPTHLSSQLEGIILHWNQLMHWEH